MSCSSDLIHVTAAPHPFRAASTHLEVAEGLTLAEILAAAQSDPILLRHAHIEIDGVPIPQERWHLIRPKAGHLVTVRVVPSGGGGKDPLGTVLAIAVVAAAVAVSAGALGPAGLGLGPTFGAGGFGAIAGAALISGVGLALLPRANLAPLSGASSVRDSPTNFIEAARNRADLWGRVPDVLGRHKMVPPYAAAPFTAVTGDAQYLHLMFAWGPGELEITDLKIGETPIANFDEVDIETQVGSGSDPPITLYTNDVSEESFALLLLQVDSWQRRTTVPGIDEISCDMTWAEGLIRFSDPKGKRRSTTVQLEVRFRKVGDVTWLGPTLTVTTVPDAWVTVGANSTTVDVTGKSTSAVRHGFRWPTAETAQYEVEWRRTTADSASTRVFDKATWTALRGITLVDPVGFPVPFARTVLRIRATDQLNRVVDTFSGVVQRVALDWDNTLSPSAWVSRATSNPASMFRHVLQGASNARPVPDAEIDLDKLQEWHDFCVLNGFECNLIVDFPSSVREILKIVCATGRASLDNVDGKWSVVIDDTRTTPVQHFTPRNSRGFRAEKLFPDRPHALRLRFNDEVNGWRTAERIVYDQGFTAANATKFEQQDLVGITNAEQARKLAIHQLFSTRLQPEAWDFDVDFEHLVAKRGDLVLFTHDVLLVGLASGRIKSLVVDGGGDVTDMTVDEALPMEMGKSYGVSVRTVNDAKVTAQVTTDPGEQTTVTFPTPIPAASAPSVGDLFAFGEFGLETVDGQVKAINRSSDLAARITLVPYFDSLFTAATGLPADFDPGLTPLFVPPPPVVQTAYTADAALGREIDATLVRVVIEVVPLNRPGVVLEVQQRPTETGEPFRGSQVVARPAEHIVVLGGLQIGEFWDLRLRWNPGTLQPGPWVEHNGLLIVGRQGPPAALQGLTISVFGGQAMLRWEQPDELDARFGGQLQFRHAPVQTGATWSTSSSIGRTIPAQSLVASLPLKDGTYLARVFDVFDEPGGIATVTTKQASVLTFDSIQSFDEDPAWAGIHTNTVNVNGNLELDRDDLIDNISDWDADIADIDNIGEIKPSGTYDFATVVDLGTVKKVRVTSRLSMASSNVRDLIDDRSGLVDDWQSWDGDDQAETDAQVWVRVTDDLPGAATTPWSDGGAFADGGGWSDAPLGGTGWKLHQRLDAAEFEARAFDFQLRLTSQDTAFTPLISDCGIEIEEVA